MKLIVFSICKDEAETIGEVLDGVPEDIDGVDEVEKWVISDGSTDATASIARKHGAQVIEGVVQKRLAYRFREAMELSLEQGADIAVGIDGDLQFEPEEIRALVAPIVSGEYDFVAGDRFTDSENGVRRRPSNMPKGKYWANRLGSWIVGKLSRQNFRDVTCGFRAYNRHAMLSLNLTSNYTYTQESFQQLAQKHLNIMAIPISVTYYTDRTSRVVTSFPKFLFGSAINILRAFRDFAPLRLFGIAGTGCFIIGLGLLVFLGVHWLETSALSPYKAVGFAGLYFVTFAFLLWLVGFVADMMRRVTTNQERMIENQKKQLYKTKK